MNTRAIRPSLTEVERSPIQRALDNYNEMERALAAAENRAIDLSVQNGALMSEVKMLREAYERADGQRIHLQAVSATLLGRLLSINDVIGGAVRASIKEGIEAVDTANAESEPERAGAEAHVIPQRVEPPAGSGVTIETGGRHIHEVVTSDGLPRVPYPVS